MTGNPITSFRSEIQGLLAWHCCMFHLTQFYDIKASITIQPYSENKKVIEYHHHITQQTIPNYPFFDDHDYFLQLQVYQKELATRGITILSTKKVKCSTRKLDDEILLEESLIRLMDDRARKYKIHKSATNDILPSIDRIHLQDHNGIITSQEKLLLEQQWPTYQVEKYYCRHFFPRNPGKTRFPVIFPTPNASIVFRSIQSPISDWTAMTSKKPSTAEPETHSELAMLTSDTNDTIQTTKL